MSDTVNSPILLPMLLSGYPGNRGQMQQMPYGIGTTYPELVETTIQFIREQLLPYVTGLNQDNHDLIDILNTALTAQTSSIMSQLQTVLAEIIAGENVNLNDGSILAALESLNSVTVAWLRGGALGFYSLAGAGIDPTGVADSTVAVKAIFAAAPAGSTVLVPSGAIIRLTDTITLDKAVHVTGAGELRWTDGIAQAPAFHVTGDNVTFEGVHMTNPNHLASATGNRNYGIDYEANYGSVIGSLLDGFQNAIWVDATGEWHHHVVHGNRVINVPGSGVEDRGDGIYMAGATFSVIGNIVTCLDGTDARIGIGAESLQAFVGTQNYQYQDMGGVISDNIVTGPFRRSIANEGVANVAITGNSVMGFTWWGINIVGTAHYTTCIGNTIRFTSTAAPANSQSYCGILVYDNVQNSRIAENTIIFVGATPGTAGIGVIAASGGHSGFLAIERNTIDGGGNRIAYGVSVSNGADFISVIGNIIRGFNTAAIALDQCNDCTVNENRIYGSSGTKGITSTGTENDGRVDGNTIEGVDNAIDFWFRGGNVSISRNNVSSCSQGISTYGYVTGIVLMLALNNFFNVTTHFAGDIPTGTGVTVTNIGNN